MRSSLYELTAAQAATIRDRLNARLLARANQYTVGGNCAGIPQATYTAQHMVGIRKHPTRDAYAVVLPDWLLERLAVSERPGTLGDLPADWLDDNERKDATP